MIKRQQGQILILAIIVLTLIMLNSIFLISRSYLLTKNSDYNTQTLQATTLAEAGVDKAVATLNKSGGNYSGETETFIGPGSYTVSITSKDSTTNIITSIGYIPNKANSKAKKTIKIETSKGSGIFFNYGILAGEGGLSISGGSRVNGSVYSNGDILISGGGVITGDAIAAGGTQPVPDQESDCINPNCTDFLFGKTVSGESRLDVAQSFKPSATKVINKVALKLKKIGSPPNLSVRILADSSNKPNKNNVLATGILSSNLVTNQYSFVDINLTTNPTLTANTPYWIMLDTTLDNINYWSWSLDNLGGYSRGSFAWAPDWQTKNPDWDVEAGDLGFRTYMGGVVTKISGTGSGYINSSAYANTLLANNSSALQIGKEAYYQNQTSIIVSGQNCTNNSHCHPNQTDPPPLSMPISQANIDEWQSLASQQVYTGNLNIQWPCTTTLNKAKYVGNVTVQAGCTINIESPVWITGNFTVQSGATVKLKSSYGSTSGVIIVGGTATLTGGSKLQGSGDPNSYLMVLSTYNSPAPDYTPAITVNGGNSASILYASQGIISLTGGTNIREVTGYKIVLDTGATVSYESGVAAPFFSSGPQGSFSIIKGTYQIQ